VGKAYLALVISDEKASLALCALFGVGACMAVGVELGAGGAGAICCLDVEAHSAGLAFVELLAAGLAVGHPFVAR
jgi:hypothetical protein